MSDNVDHSFKSPLTSISIGPGIRGIERGVERVVRLEHLAYVEIEALIIENLVAQMECGVLAPAVIWSDAKTLPCEPFRGLVDILFAGYPCQPFSTAGKRRGVEDPRHLYPYIERAIRIIRPRICFFENVRGHITCGLPEVIESLEGLGYRVHWGIYSAEETGAAHKRERVFILAVENSTGFRCGSQWTELADPNHQRCGEEREREKRINKSSVDVVMADTDDDGKRTQSGEIESSGGETKSQKQWGGWNKVFGEWVRSEPGNDCETMAYTNEQRPQKKRDHRGQIEEKNTRTSRSCVSRPGEPQQAWEHPRVISRKAESLMGLSAHGYNFREDILRALGNSVYEDTAEIAFITLLKKHRLI